MHELAITQSLLQIATDEAERIGASQIKVIRLRVGALTDIVPDSVQFYLDSMTPGTIAAGVRLETIRIPVGATCTRCDRFFVVQDYDLTCPECGGVGKITQGRELQVESLEVEE
ncbi:MAG: hydrogenase maturation nickel metallochaperone HypA [Chloroflexi bacterium]|nr:hydrogenase maturation nickel metallochaperone HypA [Chloroflexota bacterium]